MTDAINYCYLISSVLFIIGLKKLSSPKSARFGNFLSSLGMLLGIIITLFNKEIISYSAIIICIIIGSLIGLIVSKKVQMTSMPEMVAILNGAGGGASLLVGFTVFINGNIDTFNAFTIFLAILIGGVTFSGSIIAWGKLSGKVKFIPSKSILFPTQKIINLILLLLIITSGIFITISPASAYNVVIFTIIASLVLGILSVIPIGGADMPVVISLLNSYSGLAGCAAGFVIENILLIVAGALVGASGIILTIIMCKSMNRSLINVLFSGFGSKKSSSKSFENQHFNTATVQDLYYVLEAAKNVVIVPGYGMAVAGAQHSVKELSKLLEKNGTDVKFAIHPVAGRMPGHMNVLLAEADVPYDELFELDEINPSMENVDVCLIIGANDVVNTSARDDKNSPIYGMPIIEADRAKNVYIFKRSMKPGFAGIENPLFYKPNASLVFGDAKASLQALISEF
jgi:H+-translocating NAD(P) transhydrogenase subunit beta